MNTDTAPTRKPRKTIADRRAALEAQLAKLEAATARQDLEEAIAAGECYDLEGAKNALKEQRYLHAAKSTIVKYRLADAKTVDALVAKLVAQMQSAVEGPQGG